MADHNYRGYTIKTRQTAGWHANIWAPGSRLAMVEIPKATMQEGEGVCLQRAKDLIDQDLERAT